jgi:hypothetical protein
MLYTIRISIVSFIIAGLLLVSCGGKDVKPVSKDSELAQEAFKLTETLKDAYLSNDRGSLEKNSTKDGYRELMEALKSFDKAELTFTPTWVEIQDATVNVSISWKGTWVVKGKSTEERGLGVFILEGTPLKLGKIQRANPFQQPE